MMLIESSVLDDVEKTRRKVMKTVTAKEFDEKFDNSEDITKYLDFQKQKD